MTSTNAYEECWCNSIRHRKKISDKKKHSNLMKNINLYTHCILSAFALYT